MAEDVSRMGRILRILKKSYPDAHCSLVFESPFQLLCATILSAQCTDERVNKVTPILFKKFGTSHKMAEAAIESIETIIKSTGFYNAKARSLKEMSQALVAKHAGEVPKTLEELTALRGVGRKTANVVLGNAYGIPGLVVDTHVGRLCRRMGFTKATDPEKVETEMMSIVPKKEWVGFSHLLIAHGRAICMARGPKCLECPIARECKKIGI